MKPPATPARWLRRARPLLGTLVEIGLPATLADAQPCFDAGFAAVLEVQCCLSRFDADSDVSRFHALPCGASLKVRAATCAVLGAARELQVASDDAFDVSLGTGPQGWRLDGETLIKSSADVRLDVGGIAKGYAVDLAVQAIMARGCAAGWVNAGGDLRAFGDVDVPVQLRDEDTGGVRPFAALRDGAFATSHFAQGTRAQLAGLAGTKPRRVHVSVAAPQCLWADALTKLVGLRAGTLGPLLARYQATAWTH
jgi:thiamine biosynthesis lipoprotein